MAIQSEQELAETIANAARRAFRQLFEQNPYDKFYYCSLVTTGEGHTPCLTAWSREKLEEAVRAENGDDNVRAELKWSYADSPFYCYAEDIFDEVKRQFVARSETRDRDSTEDRAELELRLRAMESAMVQLDSEGLFGTGTGRVGIVINAEVMPPDRTNVERARRLNPPEALVDWLTEAAEPA